MAFVSLIFTGLSEGVADAELYGVIGRVAGGVESTENVGGDAVPEGKI